MVTLTLLFFMLIVATVYMLITGAVYILAYMDVIIAVLIIAAIIKHFTKKNKKNKE